jgi:hypothetical protein
MPINSSVIFALCLSFFTNTLTAQTPNVASGNPIFEGWYADPEGVILNREFWIFPTFFYKYKDQDFLDAFSSMDLINLKKHIRIIDT